MSHHTILGPAAQHERFMREVTRELDAFEKHERDLRTAERRASAGAGGRDRPGGTITATTSR
jgi:hypothetical protein